MDETCGSRDEGMDLRQYYQDFEDSAVRDGFRDLDDPTELSWMMQALQGTFSRNFVLDSGDEAAFAAFDLGVTPLESLLLTPRPHACHVRWINIWYPYLQRPLLELLARHYDFSPRLLGLMSSDPRLARLSQNDVSRDRAAKSAFWSLRNRRQGAIDKLEADRNSDELSEHSSISSLASIAKGNLYRIANDIWHYTSVDMGRAFVCIGYNSLYGTKDAGTDCGDGLLPHCTRVWSWLVLCGDKTVISINEDPFPFQEGRLDPLQQRILRETRRNLTNVFRSLSRVGEDSLLTHNPMVLLSIRTRLGDTIAETAHRDTDAPGLLFYYLFENWHNSYTLVTRKESRYGVELNGLRAQLFQAPQLHHIDRLDYIGKELGVLRRHYQSHMRIIDRLLEPQTATLASLQGSHVVSQASQTSLETVRALPLITEDDSLLGVSLTSAARIRFKRLKDLIDLYALSEVEEYIKQKDSLTTMNFNLVALKGADDMERLTRITLLITKATILFMPVGLMSTYFQVQFVNTQYYVRDYWVSFAVVFMMTVMALFMFGLFTRSLQSTAFFEGAWKVVKLAWGVVHHDKRRLD